MDCFLFMHLGSQHVGRLANTSRREMLLIMLWSSVKTWPAGLYMNGERAQMQSGCLDLKSIILRSYKTFLQLNIFVAICMVYVYEIIGTDWFLEYSGILDMTDLWWIIKDEVLLTVGCPIFPSFYIDSQISVNRKFKKNRSIDI